MNTSKSQVPSSRVDSSSIQSQFVALTQSRDTFRHELRQLEGQRRTVESQIASLQKTRRDTHDQIQLLHGTLGKHRMKAELYQKEQERLKQIQTVERQDLEGLVRKMEDYKVSAKRAKQEKSKEMQKISKDMDDLIRQHQDRRWVSWLSHGPKAYELLEQVFPGCNNAFVGMNEHLEAYNALKQNRQLQKDMITELDALRNEAQQNEPVSFFGKKIPFTMLALIYNTLLAYTI